VLLDLEGTLYAGQKLLPGAQEAVEELRAQGLTLRFLTNTDSRPAADLLAGLAGFGLTVGADELFTPVHAAREYLAARPGARVYPLLSQALRPEFGAAGPGAFTHVLVGDCRDTLDYPALDAAFRAVRAGAELLALQRGRYFKREDGDHLDTGGVVAALEYAAGVGARVLGKPSPDFFALAAASAGAEAAQCVAVGDDSTTDVAGGKAAGLRTVQVRTGKYADQLADGTLVAADHVLDSVADLPALLKGGGSG
jgi:HAD superfamily hydrolase (TIGR01458 family)